MIDVESQHSAPSLRGDGGRFPGSLAAETRSTRVYRMERPLRLVACAASGLLLTAAFPPLEWSWTAWFALVPMLVFGLGSTGRDRLAGGAAFGLAHCLTLFSWLNEIGFFAGFLLGAVVALFPAAWYVFVRPVVVRESPPGVSSTGCSGWLFELLAVLFSAALWVALEWVRSWLFTGLPWGFAGVSQWQNLHLLPLTTLTGVYGLSFLIIAVNASLARVVLAAWRRSWPCSLRGLAMFAGVAVLSAAAPWVADKVHPAPPAAESRVVRIGAVQGNIPQARGRADEMLPVALQAYDEVSRRLVREDSPDLLLWPETAVPAALRYNQAFADTVDALCRDTRTPLLLGSVDYRYLPPVDSLPPGEEEPPPVGFNCAFLLGADGRILEHYDKTHLVPFGEYTPFEELLPFLVEWIGMGRSLTQGREFTLFNLPGGIRTGINICYEDCFPHISRAFTRRGAEVLATITNDAWYAQSAGSRQHMIHAVFRAVENRRPLMRSGNNSDTCLILADGSVEGLLCDPDTGSRFVRAGRTYELHPPGTLPLTFYTRYGDVFAWLCCAVVVAAAVPTLTRFLRRKVRLYTVVRGVAPQ